MNHNDPEVPSISQVLEEDLKKSLQEEYQETSYIPMIVLIFNVALLAVGLCWYFMQSRNVVMVDSLWPLIWKCLGVAMLVYQIPLLMACRTDYQINTGRSRSTYMLFSCMAIAGFLLLFHPLLHTWNAFAAQGGPVTIKAQVVRIEYITGSKGGTGLYHMDLKLSDHPGQQYPVKNLSRHDFIAFRDKKTAEVSLYPGALGMRWFRLIKS